MADGGLVIRFDAEEPQAPQRGYAVTLDYDTWSYRLNNESPVTLPRGTRTITIEIEQA